VPWAVRESITRHRDRMLKPGDPVDGRRIVVFSIHPAATALRP
jgi:hypothetical protein